VTNPLVLWLTYWFPSLQTNFFQALPFPLHIGLLDIKQVQWSFSFWRDLLHSKENSTIPLYLHSVSTDWLYCCPLLLKSFSIFAKFSKFSYPSRDVYHIFTSFLKRLQRKTFWNKGKWWKWLPANLVVTWKQWDHYFLRIVR